MDINDPRHPMNSLNRYAREEQARLTAKEVAKQVKQEKDKSSSFSLPTSSSSDAAGGIVIILGVVACIFVLPAIFFQMLSDDIGFWSSVGENIFSLSSWLASACFWGAIAAMVYFYKQSQGTSKGQSEEKVDTQPNSYTDGNDTQMEDHEEEDLDDLFWDAARIVVEEQAGSVSVLQRKLSIGHSRASRLIEQLEQANIVGPYEGGSSRQVYVTSSWLDRHYPNSNHEA